LAEERQVGRLPALGMAGGDRPEGRGAGFHQEVPTGERAVPVEEPGARAPSSGRGLEARGLDPRTGCCQRRRRDAVSLPDPGGRAGAPGAALAAGIVLDHLFWRPSQQARPEPGGMQRAYATITGNRLVRGQFWARSLRRVTGPAVNPSIDWREWSCPVM
jgi:hypothetical protein